MTWKTVNAKVKEQDLSILNNRLKVYGFDTLGDLVKDFMAGKFPQVTDDKQIEMFNNQASGQLTNIEDQFDPTFYKGIDYQDMTRYLHQLRKYSLRYAKQQVSYFRQYADTFFKEPEKIHELAPGKRAWVLGSMRAFGVYYEYYTKGNRDAGELVNNLIRRYQLNRGLDMHHKIYLVEDNHLSEKIKLVMAVPGDLGFIIRLGLFSGLQEEELLYAYDNRASLQTVQKRNGTLTVLILNRFQAKKNAYFTILPTSIWYNFKSLPSFSYEVDISSAHKMTNQAAGVPYKYLRKMHWNIMSRTMSETEAGILAGRAKSVSAKHYALYELDSLADKYAQSWKKFDVNW